MDSVFSHRTVYSVYKFIKILATSQHFSTLLDHIYNRFKGRAHLENSSPNRGTFLLYKNIFIIRIACPITSISIVEVVLVKFNKITRNLEFWWISTTIWWKFRSNVLTYTLNFFITIHPKIMKLFFISE